MLVHGDSLASSGSSIPPRKLRMQLTSITLLLFSTAVPITAAPAAVNRLEVRETAANTNGSTPKGADFACPHSAQIVANQLAEMAQLKAKKIPIPPFLSGYYSAINGGIEEIGCPDAPIALEERSFKANREPCDVVNDQHERMMKLINGFDASEIGIAPYLAGFLSATIDGHTALLCPPFSGPATDVAVAAKYEGASASDAVDVNTGSDK